MADALCDVQALHQSVSAPSQESKATAGPPLKEENQSNSHTALQMATTVSQER